ncbi:hypothetical protein FBU30_008221 [Linnemannia zychae]|nr:hypothetical protein FBU30_008221 [Linnemannia zychae]
MGDKYPNPKNRFVRYPNTSTQTHSDLVWGVPPNQMTRTTNPLYSLELSSNVSPQDVLLNPSNPLVASTSINEAESNPCNASDGVRGQSQLRCGDYLSQYFGDPHNNAATSGVGNIYFNVDLGNHNEAWPSVPQAPQAAFGNQNIYAHAQEAASHNSFTVPIALNSSASCERLLPTPTATGTSTPLPCLVPESYSQHQPQPQQRNHETNDDGRINSENIVSVQQQLVDLMTGIQGSQKSLQLKQKQNDWLNQGAFYQESSEYGLLSSHEDNSTPCSTTINSNQCQEPLQTQDFCHQSQNLDLQQLHKHQGIHGLVHDFTSGSSTPSSNCGLHTLVMPDIYEDFESTLNQGQLRKILSTDHPVDSAVHTPSQTSKNQENLRDCVTPLSMNTSPVGRIAVNDCWIKVESNKQLSMPVSGAIETQLWGHIFRSADNKELFFAQFAEYNNYRSQDCGLNDDSDDSDDSDGNGDNDNNDDDSSDSDNDGYVQSGVDDQNDGNVDFSSDSQRSSGSHSSSRGRSCIRGLGRGRGRGRGRGGRPYTSQKTTIVNPRPPPVQDSVTIASERLLLCTFPHCTRTFTTIGLLKSHLVSHNDAKPYWCDICSPDGIVPRDPTPPEHPALSATAPEVKRYKRHHDLLRHKREQHPPLEVRIQRALEKLAAKEARKAKAALAKASQDNGRRRSTKKTTNSVATATMVPVATTLTVHGQTATLAQCSIQASNLFTTATNMTTMATNTAIPSTSTMTAIPEVIQVSTASHKRKLMDSGHSNRSSEGNEEVNDSSYQGSHAKNFRTSRRRSRTTPTQSTSTQGQIQDSEVSSPSQNHSHSVYESSDSE